MEFAESGMSLFVRVFWGLGCLIMKPYGLSVSMLFASTQS